MVFLLQSYFVAVKYTINQRVIMGGIARVRIYQALCS